ncbi:MAG TPA: hypothetical protein DDW21_07480 [Verrucomicrobiales bacterium]|nr:MAG: hypothetical protein CAK88_04780 [Verrucomicrobiae bacterium AMD-G2]HBE23268.1 hypothetical protein [Verrucomicrobiales bacterium]
MISMKSICAVFAYSGREVFLWCAALIESHGFADAMKVLVVDASLLLVEPGIAFTEAPAGADTATASWPL